MENQDKPIKEFIYDTKTHKWLAKLSGTFTREHLIEIVKSLNYSTDKH